MGSAVDQIDTHAKITHISWGKMEVMIGPEKRNFKDCKVWPDGAKEWNWAETETHHHPGIQVSDIHEILDAGIDVMILSRGMELQLRTTPEVETLLQERGIEYHIEETNQAVALFNKFSAVGRRVGGIFHSTC